MKSSFYINVNGKYGMGAYEKADYPYLSDLVAQMDRLGICQSIAYHVAGRDLNTTCGNRMLTEDIDRLGLKDRIIPAFAAAPSNLYSNGEMDQLKLSFSKDGAAFLILYPKTYRFRIIEISRVLEELKGYNPVVLIDAEEMISKSDVLAGLLDLRELIELCGMFPGIKFIIKQAIWWHMSVIVDAMKRAGNIYLDTSWLHNRDAIEIITNEIGEDRLVFGIGTKSHSGAAIGALAYSGISQEQKDCIAYENLVSLISSDSIRESVKAGRRKIGNKVGNSFWNHFIDGKGVLAGVKVIDAHGHIGPFARGWYLRDNEPEKQIEVLKKQSKIFGIDKYMSCPENALFGEPVEGNELIESLLLEDTDKFNGYLVYNPYYADSYNEKLFDNFFSRGYFKGFKFLPEYLKVEISSPKFEKAMKYANKHKLPILIHTWEGSYGTARQVADVAVNYPDAIFLLGHSGGTNEGRHQCEMIAGEKDKQNCIFEFCGTFVSNIEWSESLEKIDYRRVVYGSDTVPHDIAFELGRLLSLEISDDKITAILGENMSRILDRIEL